MPGPDSRIPGRTRGQEQLEEGEAGRKTDDVT